MRPGSRTIAANVALVVAVLGAGASCAVGQSDAATPVPASAATSGIREPRPSQSAALSALDPAARRYVDAVAAADLDGLVASFAADGVVVDVGREFRGRDAIRRWAANEVIGGRLTVLDNAPRAGGTTMLVRFAPGGSGGFEARYDFDIGSGVITRATLSYA